MGFSKVVVSVALGGVLAGAASGCSMLGMGGTETLSIGEVSEQPAGAGETEATMNVAVTAMEKAPEKVVSQFQDGAEVWFVTATFERAEGELAKYDYTSPWDNLNGYLEDGTVYDAMGGGGDMGECAWEGDELQALQEDYAAGKKVEVCVPVFSDSTAGKLTGAFYGDSSAPEAGVAWTK